jgi:hypothetical protein
VWFIDARPNGNPPSSQRLTTGKLTASAMVIAIGNGRTAVVTVASPAAAPAGPAPATTRRRQVT